MAKPLVSDELWEHLSPCIPPPKPRPWGHPGRKRIADRKVLTGIVFVLKTGIPWEDLPQEMGCGSGMTCWRRLREWQEAGVWEKMHAVMVERLEHAELIDWSRAIADSSSLRAVGGGEKDRPESHRPRQTRDEAPRRHRR